MIIQHPFQKIARSEMKRYFIAFLISAILLEVVLMLLGSDVKTDKAPLGIISFEFAGTLSNAQDIVNSWGPFQLIEVAFSIGIDYLFLFFYSSAIAFGCVLVATGIKNELFAKIGIALAWLQWIAAFFDGLENYALYHMLLNNQSQFLVTFAWWCAAFKFAMIVAGLLYAIKGGLIRYLFHAVRNDATRTVKADN